MRSLRGKFLLLTVILFFRMNQSLTILLKFQDINPSFDTKSGKFETSRPQVEILEEEGPSTPPTPRKPARKGKGKNKS